ncbi:FGGY-family carbohydrate kinase [Qingshengfaniella alkalisoli]|uniref:Ribulokinase n=1 Tax=Qingshengfaniella alkalisoli TaxID=2599296 RepID=A0A5B8IZL1_9RHOB|nr:FGGY-family carbohydrate kinase [Qingshengfaniella alkalisoli]QDY71114.1 ribulokinase [Qingshengfaniella alkalisoli]
MQDFVVAVDVGTRSARAGVFDRSGSMQGAGIAELDLLSPSPGSGEYASEEVWAAVCEAVQQAVRSTTCSVADIAAIGFDATCSLVLRDKAGEPLAVSDRESSGDTLAWFDHRATAQAAWMSALGHPVTARNGGNLSPEMQLPKLKWLKDMRPGVWDVLGYAFDLADFLTWRASGNAARSVCTLSAKWGYQVDRGGWPSDFLEAADLPDMVCKAGMPAKAIAVGDRVGQLSKAAAAELGLTENCAVASGMVDAYAGALALLDPARPEALALVAGTSTCVMGYGDGPIALAGFWGPYPDAVLPGRSIFETGQSATGSMLDRIITAFALSPTRDMHDRIAEYIDHVLENDPNFGKGIDILPDFHGNRSPLADPLARGAIIGLSLDTSFHELCRTYWRGCVALALALKQLIQELRKSGQTVSELRMSGGHIRFRRLPQLYADATGCVIYVPDHENAALRGSAIAAAKAAGWSDDLAVLSVEMADNLTAFDPDEANYLLEDYRTFLEIQSFGK